MKLVNLENIKQTCKIFIAGSQIQQLANQIAIQLSPFTMYIYQPGDIPIRGVIEFNHQVSKIIIMRANEGKNNKIYVSRNTSGKIGRNFLLNDQIIEYPDISLHDQEEENHSNYNNSKYDVNYDNNSFRTNNKIQIKAPFESEDEYIRNYSASNSSSCSSSNSSAYMNVDFQNNFLSSEDGYESQKNEYYYTKQIKIEQPINGNKKDNNKSNYNHQDIYIIEYHKLNSQMKNSQIAVENENERVCIKPDKEQPKRPFKKKNKKNFPSFSSLSSVSSFVNESTNDNDKLSQDEKRKRKLIKKQNLEEETDEQILFKLCNKVSLNKWSFKDLFEDIRVQYGENQYYCGRVIRILAKNKQDILDIIEMTQTYFQPNNNSENNSETPEQSFFTSSNNNISDNNQILINSVNYQQQISSNSILESKNNPIDIENKQSDQYTEQLNNFANDNNNNQVSINIDDPFQNKQDVQDNINPTTHLVQDNKNSSLNLKQSTKKQYKKFLLLNQNSHHQKNKNNQINSIQMNNITPNCKQRGNTTPNSKQIETPNSTQKKKLKTFLITDSIEIQDEQMNQ